MTAAVVASNNGELDEHVGYIARQLKRSLEEGGVRQLAVKLVSSVYDFAHDPRSGEEVRVVRAWGKTFLAPPGGICPSRDDMCEIEKVWDFMVLNFRYVYDPTEYDTFATAKESMLAGGGDCDDATIAFAALLGSIGFRVLGRVISEKSRPREWVHIYPMVGVPKDNPSQWIPLDMTVDGSTPGWEYPNIARHKDYLLT